MSYSFCDECCFLSLVVCSFVLLGFLLLFVVGGGGAFLLCAFVCLSSFVLPCFCCSICLSLSHVEFSHKSSRSS